MNVAVVSTHVPFGSSRVDDVRDELGRQLAARGITVVNGAVESVAEDGVRLRNGTLVPVAAVAASSVRDTAIASNPLKASSVRVEAKLEVRLE